MKIFKNISYNDFCQLDIYAPEKEDFETIVYFHGGGLSGGDKEFFAVAEQFVEFGYGVVSANYRMYSDGVKFPVFLFDAADAVAYVKKHIGEYGGNGNLYIDGGSAGAWLTVMLCVDPSYLRNVGVDTAEIKGWISDSAQMTSHFNAQHLEYGRAQWVQRIDELAPLYYVDEKTHFSKMLLIFYEHDLPCRPEQNMLFYKAVLHFNPQADICYRSLKGGHCVGLFEKDEDGLFPHVKETIAWLKKE
ncbi:MAG: alpha/beta hydrolase [Clostridia bacterium]|nr:alpha/beta hydrolase [Clostridia bacterium]